MINFSVMADSMQSEARASWERFVTPLSWVQTLDEQVGYAAVFAMCLPPVPCLNTSTV
jgi:hypothetical protein